MMNALYILTLVTVFILRLSQMLLKHLMLPAAIPMRRLTAMPSVCTPTGDCRDRRIHPGS